jgi:ABC-2 type transport system ATP-binding protein
MPDLLEPADPRGGSHPVAPAGSRQKADGSKNGFVAHLDLPAKKPLPTAPAHCPLVFEHVSKWYGPVIGVNQVTLELRPGITGLVGANGAGKSTLMRLASGQVRPDLGSVKVCGHDAWSATAKLHFGYCPDVDTFYEEMSGRRFIETMARLCGYSRAEARRRSAETLDLVGMSGRAERKLAGYSKGMRQRIKLAQALLHDPQLLLLDEPLSGIDPIGRRESIELFLELARRGKCLLISSHELEELEKLTDHVAIMSRGRIAAVGPLVQIRDLLDNHPLSIRVASDQNRKLAAVLLELDEVVGVDREDEDHLIVRARQPRKFFQKLSELVLEEAVDIRHLETLDESTHAILGYLLGGKPPGRITR